MCPVSSRKNVGFGGGACPHYGQAEASDEERRYIYDTTLIGHSNAGHTFGNHLSDAERTALVEYLKTL